MIDGHSSRPDFAALYDASFAKVYNYVRYRVSDPAVADDITSRVFEKALEHLDRYDARRGPPDAWLWGIARNAVQDHFRAKARSSWLSLASLWEWVGQDIQEERQPSAQEHEELFAALGSLEDREREILALKFGAGMTNRAIAAELSLTESNVGVIVFRAVKKLQQRLREDL